MSMREFSKDLIGQFDGEIINTESHPTMEVGVAAEEFEGGGGICHSVEVT